MAFRLKIYGQSHPVSKGRDAPSVGLSSVSLNQSSVQGVSEGKLAKVLDNIILHLVSLEAS